jgi:DNA-binding Xre family transcriptional regulator
VNILENYNINYNPLKETLKEKNITLTKMMKDLGASTRTRAKINQNEAVNLNTVGKMCAYLSVSINHVVEIELQK